MAPYTLSVLILDLISVAVILLLIWLGSCKGFVRTIAQIAAYVVIFAISSSLSRAASPVLYDRFIAPSLSDGISQQFSSMENATFTSGRQILPTLWSSPSAVQMSSGDPNIQVVPEPPSSDITVIPEEKVHIPQNSTSSEGGGNASSGDANTPKPGLLTKFSDWLRELLGLEKRRNPPQDVKLPNWMPQLSEEVMPNITSAAEQATTELLDAAIRPIAISSIGAVTFAIFFLILSIIANIVLRLLGVIDYIPVIGRLNRFMGAVLGFFQGLLVLWILGLLLGGLVKLSGGSWMIFTAADLDAGLLFPLLSNPLLLFS